MIRKFFVGMGLVLLPVVSTILVCGVITFGVVTLLVDYGGFHPLVALLTAVTVPVALAGGVANALSD